jgi:hypothetical protein
VVTSKAPALSDPIPGSAVSPDGSGLELELPPQPDTKIAVQKMGKKRYLMEGIWNILNSLGFESNFSSLKNGELLSHIPKNYRISPYANVTVV